jgi:phage gpG-like protein
VSDEVISINLSGLKQIIKAITSKVKLARVGIFGAQNAREGKGTNANIGAIHEFGGPKVKKRSFLRDPLNEHLAKKIDKDPNLENSISGVVRDGDFVDMTRKIAQMAVSIILEGFATGGFGKWKQSNMKYKKVQQTLVETQQLRDSITWEVR